MKHSDFVIGGSFWCAEREWRCTDIGTRTIIAICLDATEVVTSFRDSAVPEKTRTLMHAEANAEGWFNGPPYAVAERVFDEYDQIPCAFDAEGNGETSIDLSGFRHISLEDMLKDATERHKARKEKEAS